MSRRCAYVNVVTGSHCLLPEGHADVHRFASLRRYSTGHIEAARAGEFMDPVPAVRR